MNSCFRQATEDSLVVVRDVACLWLVTLLSSSCTSNLTKAFANQTRWTSSARAPPRRTASASSSPPWPSSAALGRGPSSPRTSSRSSTRASSPGRSPTRFATAWTSSCPPRPSRRRPPRPRQVQTSLPICASAYKRGGELVGVSSTRLLTTQTGANGQQQPQPAATSTIQTIVPLFKLTKGCASSSDGFSCAVLAGLATPVVQRAE